MSEDAPTISPGLTEKQTSRALAYLAGKTPAEIAAEEGVAKQSVAETLGAKRVRATLADLAARVRVKKKNAAGVVVSVRTLEAAALEALIRLLDARKVVVHGSDVTWVPDNATQFAAATRVLEICGSSPAVQAPRPAVPALEESVEVQERQTTRRVSRRRIRDAQ